MCGVPAEQAEGKEGAAGEDKVQEAKRVQVTGPGRGHPALFASCSPLPHCLALLLAGGLTHMLLTHPSALRDSWEGCEAPHVPTGGREAGKEGGFQYQVPFAARAAPKGKMTPARGPLRVQAPGLAPALLQLTIHLGDRCDAIRGPGVQVPGGHQRCRLLLLPLN